MTIGALEISTPALLFRWYVPTPTSLICNQWKVVLRCNLLYKIRVILDGCKTILYGQCGSAERFQCPREALRRSGEDPGGNRRWKRVLRIHGTLWSFVRVAKSDEAFPYM